MPSPLQRALLYARTVRHLRWEQWLYRPVRRVQGVLGVRLPTPLARPNAAAIPHLAAVVGEWRSPFPDRLHDRVSEVMDGRFTFLGHTEHLPVVDWRLRHVSHLWSYNLHYFDYALDLAWAFRATNDIRLVRRFETLACEWIDALPPGRADGWEPYALSLRVVNWMYALLLFGNALHDDVRARLERSIVQQLAFLERRLELHILANHLLKNLKALVIGGICFEGAAAREWHENALPLLWRELFEQILPDGCHYERAPMYHAIALGDWLELLALMDAARIEVPAAARDRVRAAVRAAGVLIRPDGTLHLFNDSADGIAPSRVWLDHMASTVVGAPMEDVEGSFSLPDGGYFGWADSRSGERLVVDCGLPGPAYQPGHVHCDLLSFELDIGGTPLVVDSGVCGYDGDPLREYVRSTRAHNTVMVGGREQSEVWGTFRVARRAAPLESSFSHVDGAFVFNGSCCHYHDRTMRHHRTIRRSEDGWSITDRILGAPGKVVTSFLHLHPAFAVNLRGSSALAESPALTMCVDAFGADEVRMHDGEEQPPLGWYCPRFGSAIAAPVLSLTLASNDGREFGWTLRRIR